MYITLSKNEMRPILHLLAYLLTNRFGRQFSWGFFSPSIIRHYIIEQCWTCHFTLPLPLPVSFLSHHPLMFFIANIPNKLS